MLPRNPSRRASQYAPDKAAISAIGAIRANPARPATRLAIAPSCRKQRKAATVAEVTQQTLVRDTFLSDTIPPIAGSLVQPVTHSIVPPNSLREAPPCTQYESAACSFCL